MIWNVCWRAHRHRPTQPDAVQLSPTEHEQDRSPTFTYLPTPVTPTARRQHQPHAGLDR